MDESEIARRASGLPGRFADRVPAATREILELMESGGEYGELTIEPAAGQVPVTAAERDELRALLEAMQMPSEPIGRLNVRG